MFEFKAIKEDLEALVDPVKREFLPHFFKTGKGEYGEGDKFLGVIVPRIRSVAKKHIDVSFDTLSELLCSEWHEIRQCALLILSERFKKMKDEPLREEIYNYYLLHTKTINNWDLVDLSAPYIIGGYLLNKDRSQRMDLYRLVESKNIWEQRMAIVSTVMFIRNNDFIDTIELSKKLMYHPHDLIHKATGWMLREVGKKDIKVLKEYLEKYATELPRVTLRYAIEKFTDEERQYYLKKH